MGGERSVAVDEYVTCATNGLAASGSRFVRGAAAGDAGASIYQTDVQVEEPPARGEAMLATRGTRRIVRCGRLSSERFSKLTSQSETKHA